jgi:hypothetical protein
MLGTSFEGGADHAQEDASRDAAPHQVLHPLAPRHLVEVTHRQDAEKMLVEHGEHVVKNLLDPVQALIKAHARFGARSVVQRFEFGECFVDLLQPRLEQLQQTLRLLGCDQHRLLRCAADFHHQPLLEQSREHSVAVGAADTSLACNIRDGRLPELERRDVELHFGLLKIEGDQNTFDAHRPMHATFMCITFNGLIVRSTKSKRLPCLTADGPALWQCRVCLLVFIAQDCHSSLTPRLPLHRSRLLGHARTVVDVVHALA